MENSLDVDQLDVDISTRTKLSYCYIALLLLYKMLTINNMTIN